MIEAVAERSTVDAALYVASRILESATLVRTINGSDTHVLWEWEDEPHLSVDTVLARPLSAGRRPAVEQALFVVDRLSIIENLPVSRQPSYEHRASLDVDASAKHFIEDFAKRYAQLGISPIPVWPKFEIDLRPEQLIRSTRDYGNNFRYIMTPDMKAALSKHRIFEALVDRDLHLHPPVDSLLV